MLQKGNVIIPADIARATVLILVTVAALFFGLVAIVIVRRRLGHKKT